MGTPLVSGRNLLMNVVITTTKHAKKMNNPNFMWQSIAVKICAMAKVKIMFTDTFTLCAAERTSSGNISLGTNHPRGPHDHANPATYTHMPHTTTMAYHFGNTPGSPSSPNLHAIATVITIYTTPNQTNKLIASFKKSKEFNRDHD